MAENSRLLKSRKGTRALGRLHSDYSKKIGWYVHTTTYLLRSRYATEYSQYQVLLHFKLDTPRSTTYISIRKGSSIFITCVPVPEYGKKEGYPRTYTDVTRSSNHSLTAPAPTTAPPAHPATPPRFDHTNPSLNLEQQTRQKENKSIGGNGTSDGRALDRAGWGGNAFAPSYCKGNMIVGITVRQKII
jgi:hypothetical protein